MCLCLVAKVPCYQKNSGLRLQPYSQSMALPKPPPPLCPKDQLATLFPNWDQRGWSGSPLSFPTSRPSSSLS